MKRKCPQCRSLNVMVHKDDFESLACKSCGYDELVEDTLVEGQRTSQREKARYNPYKVGGKGRTRKK
ncbi:MAG: hypothetical protein AABY40_00740 [Nanoarchaeota archaeon]